MRRLLRKIYPDHDELAIFTMAVSMIVLLLINPGFQNLLATTLHAFLIELPGLAFDESTFKGIQSLVGGLMLFIVSVIAIGASLCLPFTRKNLDVVVAMVVIYHGILILAGNLYAFDKLNDPLSALFFGASLLWFFGFCIKFRLDGSSLATTGRHASTREAAIAGISATIIVTVLSAGFGMHWAHCYAMAAAYAFALTRFLEARAQARER